jgi:hypothetical protein
MQKFLESTTQNIGWFVKRNELDELELKAPFQRNPVWSDRQKAYLIDTILQGYPIPEIYLQEIVDADGNSKFIVVDGQQRLRACIDYVAGKFALDGEDSPDFPDFDFDELSASQKKQIFAYKFVVRCLPEMDEAQLRTMFQRLNRNVVALNRQELRHSTYWGKFISTVERIADDERWSHTAIFSPNDVRRMLDIEFVSELAVALIHGLQNKKEDLDNWYKAYEKEFPQQSMVEDTFRNVLVELTKMLPEISTTRWSKKSDFYTLFLVMARSVEVFPLNKNSRKRFSASLIEFGSAVDKFISGSSSTKAPRSVRRYSKAVEKAASDLSSRKVRDEEVAAIFEKAVD